jgi:hypothetical protein
MHRQFPVIVIPDYEAVGKSKQESRLATSIRMDVGASNGSIMRRTSELRVMDDLTTAHPKLRWLGS